MAIVSNWSKPLEDSLKSLLNKPDLSLEEILQVEKTAGLLEGAPVSKDLRELLAKRKDDLEKRYLEAVELTEKYSSVSVVEDGIKKLEKLGNYKDAPAKIEKARTRVRKLKKRPKIIMAAAAVIVVILTGVFNVFQTNERRKTEEQIAVAQQQADAGNHNDAIAIVTELNGKGKTAESFPEMGKVVETVLENTWAMDGGAAAFELYDSLQGTIPGAFKENQFYAFADDNLFMDHIISPEEKWSLLLRLKEDYHTELSDEQQAEIFFTYVLGLDEAQAWPVIYKTRVDQTLEISDEMLESAYRTHVQNLPAQTAWEELYTYQEDNMLEDLPEEARSKVEDAMLQLLTEELGSEKSRDLSKWAEDNRLMMDRMRADPDIALHFLYALHDQGYDIARLFPDGILVRIPIAENVMNLTESLINSEQDAQWPDMTTILPVSVTERDYWQGRAIYRVTAKSSRLLEEKVKEMQEAESHYEVRLLTQYLYSIDENKRPASYAECGSLMSMQNTYLLTSTVYTESKNTVTNPYLENDYLTSLLGNKSDNKPVFSALDMIAVYSVSDPKASLCASVKVNPAQAEDEEWFEAHKTQSGWEDESTMLGVFDRETLKKDYEKLIESSDNIELAILLSGLEAAESEAAESGAAESGAAESGIAESGTMDSGAAELENTEPEET